MLFVGAAGNTNAGAPSEEFAYTPDYAMSGAILKIRLSVLDAMAVKTDAAGQKYIYDMPTLDDPTRANGANGADLPGTATSGTGADPFGGNDGRNQARFLGNIADESGAHLCDGLPQSLRSHQRAWTAGSTPSTTPAIPAGAAIRSRRW